MSEFGITHLLVRNNYLLRDRKTKRERERESNEGQEVVCIAGGLWLDVLIYDMAGSLTGVMKDFLLCPSAIQYVEAFHIRLAHML